MMRGEKKRLMVDLRGNVVNSMFEWIPSSHAVIPEPFVYRNLLHTSEKLTHRGYYLTRSCLRLWCYHRLWYIVNLPVSVRCSHLRHMGNHAAIPMLLSSETCDCADVQLCNCHLKVLLLYLP
jgi:hypothetical protein